MTSLYLRRQTPEQRTELIRNLHQSQNNVCFICEEPIDLAIHKDALDIDHIIPISVSGKDDPSNFALTHASCNRAKQASNLEVARTLCRLDKIRSSLASENRGPNLADILAIHGGAKHNLNFSRQGDRIRFACPELGSNQITDLPIYTDELSGFGYFFTKLPIAYLHHDDKINPRAIGQNISKLIQEFYLKRPQLHPSLGWIHTADGEPSTVRIFDGQHKAAAQILLGVRSLPVRVFINPDIDILLKTNFNAGTSLRQVAFDKSVQRHLGNTVYVQRVERYQAEHNLAEDHFGFSESDLVKYFRGESREVKKYILDAVRDTITYHPDNKLKEYVDLGGRNTERPLSYSTIEKTFYSFFIYQDVLDTPLDFRLDEEENPREHEKEQILQLMNIIAEEIFVGRFDPDIGTLRIENRIQKGEVLPLEHIRAFRMSKEEVVYNWLKYVEQIIKNYFIMQGRPIQEEKLFHYKFPQPLWDRIRVFIRNLSNLPIWVNNELSQTVFGGKQNYAFWQAIFETGKSPQGVRVLAEPLDLMKMIQE
ncbi:MAG: HNH endonuclease [Chloroflexi bacterium]|nr:HNH endonuclease [Chloroflexota bacterium]